METPLRDIVLSWIYALGVGGVLWPPRAVYWGSLAAFVGGALTMLLVLTLAIGLGFAFAHVTGMALHPLVVGAVLAYLSGMVAIEAVLSPDSPVHFVLYGGLSLCFVGGAILCRQRA